MVWLIIVCIVVCVRIKIARAATRGAALFLNFVRRAGVLYRPRMRHHRAVWCENEWGALLAVCLVIGNLGFLWGGLCPPFIFYEMVIDAIFNNDPSPRY